MSHSHGGNLLNTVSQRVPSQYPIELMLHFACPRKTDPRYQPTNYKKLIYFYSDSDWVTIGGRSSESSAIKNIALSMVGGAVLVVGVVATIGYIIHEFNKKDDPSSNDKKEESKPKIEEKGFFTKTDENCQHAKTTAAKAAFVGAAIGGTISIYSQLPGTNEFEEQQDNHIIQPLQTLGLRTQIDGVNPGHSYVTDAVSHLIDIFNKINTDFKDQNNTIFNLSIDTHNKSIAITPHKTDVKVADLLSAAEESETQPS